MLKLREKRLSLLMSIDCRELRNPGDVGATIALHRDCVLVQNRHRIAKRKDRLCQLEPPFTSVSTPSTPNNTADGMDNSPRASSTRTTCKRWPKPRDLPK